MRSTDPIEVATLSGIVDLRNPDPAKITLEAIAHQLAGLNRWVAATEMPISVAQHSEIVFHVFCRLFPKLRRRAIYALLHDGHEYVLGDIVTPVQRLLAEDDPAIDARIAHWKAVWDVAIRTALLVPQIVPGRDDELMAAIHAADIIARDIEWKLWMPAANGRSPYDEIARRHGHHGYRVQESKSRGAAAIDFASLVTRELTQRPWEIAA